MAGTPVQLSNSSSAAAQGGQSGDSLGSSKGGSLIKVETGPIAMAIGGLAAVVVLVMLMQGRRGRSGGRRRARR